MDNAIDKIINDYIRLVRKTFAGFKKAYVFGSYVRGNYTQDSDIDIAVIFKELDDSRRFDTQVKLMLLASEIDSRIEPHPVSYNDFVSGNPFVSEIKKTGIELQEKVL